MSPNNQNEVTFKSHMVLGISTIHEGDIYSVQRIYRVNITAAPIKKAKKREIIFGEPYMKYIAFKEGETFTSEQVFGMFNQFIDAFREMQRKETL